MAFHADYEVQRIEARDSARLVLPLVIELLQPTSVVDVGCGIGAWVGVLDELGIKDYLGIDGPWMRSERLSFDRSRFLEADVAEGIVLDRRFDLVLCLEVAEHIDADSAHQFIENLTSLGPVVLFSAAVPHQGGCGHVNEQWPEYWVNRFDARGFEVIDCIRPQVWNNEQVSWWYAQNTLLFAQPETIASNPRLEDWRKRTNRNQLALVHPRKLEAIAEAARHRPLKAARLRRLLSILRQLAHRTGKR